MHKAQTHCATILQLGRSTFANNRHGFRFTLIFSRLVQIGLVLVFLSSWPGYALAQRGDRQYRIKDHFQERQHNRRRGDRPPERPVREGFRSISGYGNNPDNPNFGKAGVILLRKAPAAYFDGASAPPRTDQPSAREISNAICDQTELIFNDRGLTDMVWQWGQFLDHDIDLTESHVPLEPFPILVPSGDIWFDPDGTGTELIFMFRSIYATNTGTTNNRHQINEITAWIDGSNVYGSDQEVADSLRSFVDGKLLVSSNETGDLLPEDEDGFFLAGDIRANEQIGLTAMHTLFMREHNRWCDLLKQFSPNLSDELLYQHARKRVVATIQSITYNEFIPALMGSRALDPYRGYDRRVSPNIANTFSTAAYRFGHSMLPLELLRLDNDLNVIPEGNIELVNAFFNPDETRRVGIEPTLMGLMNQQAQEVDGKVNGAIRNFLFGAPGAGGFDLASLNIQRGRDHGLSNINMIRWSYGLSSMPSFAHLTSKPDTRADLFNTYSGINKADPWIVMLCEDHVDDSSLGETAHAVLKDQFERLRDGDPFWYQREFSGSARRTFDDTRLSHVIRRNTTLTNIRSDVFRMP